MLEFMVNSLKFFLLQALWPVSAGNFLVCIQTKILHKMILFFRTIREVLGRQKLN